MEFSKEEVEMAMDSMASTIRKTEKVCDTLKSKETNRKAQITLAQKRLEVFTTASLLLNEAYQGEVVSQVGIEERQRLQELLPPIKAQVEAMLPKFKVGTPQHTLAVRRSRAFEIVLLLAQ